jgi:hypothetical protein
MRSTPAIVWCLALFCVCIASAGDAAGREIAVESVAPGGEVMVMNHKNWGKGCKPRPAPTIKIIVQPSHGTVSLRPGKYPVKQTLHPDADTACVGRTLPGIGIFYKANAGYRGADTFTYEVTVGLKDPRTYDFDAKITVK